MKTAFAIDFLLERTPEVFLLELLLAGHEDAEIYCLAHAQGSILGPIERHRIIASPLSRFVDSPAGLRGKSWLIPSAAKQLRIDPKVEKLIILSSGWAHTFVTAPGVERYTWVYDWESPLTQLSGLARVFTPYHRQTKLTALKHATQLSFSSQTLANHLGFPQAKVIVPAFKTEEFPFVTDEDHPGEYPHHLVLLGNAPKDTVRALIAAAQERQVPLKFLGDDREYVAEKAMANPNLEFIGDHCEATTAALTHGARAVWVLGSSPFPSAALGAHCCGRPVIVTNGPVNHEFLGSTGAWFLSSASEIAALLVTVEREYRQVDRKQLRRLGLKWNERLFKSQMRTFTGLGGGPRPAALLS